MSHNEAKARDGGKKNLDTAEQRGEPEFPYSVELVAQIAAHFAAGENDDRVATERAIRLLDEVSKTIERKTILLRAHAKAEREADETPKHRPFTKGIIWIMGRRTETEAIKPFRACLRFALRLGELGRPSVLSEEQIKALLEPFPDGPEKQAEDKQVEVIEARYRSNGFSRGQLLSIKADWEHLEAGFIRPYQNSEKGKKGAAAKRAKKVVGAKRKTKK